MDLTKRSPPSDVRSTVLNTYSPGPTYIIDLTSAIPSNTHTPVANNTLIEPTEELKTVVNDIIEIISLLTAPMSYETDTVLLHMSKLSQELKVASSNYQAAMLHRRKYLLREITAPIKILNRHHQEHQYLPNTALNHFEADERADAAASDHRYSTNELPHIGFYIHLLVK